MSEASEGSRLVVGHFSTHPFLEANSNPIPTLTQTLHLTQGRVGTTGPQPSKDSSTVMCLDR